MKIDKLLVLGLACMLIALSFANVAVAFEETDKLNSDLTSDESLLEGSSPDNPIMIEDVSDLQDMNQNLTAHYELANNIDASETEVWNDGAGFEPIGTHSDRFTGSLEGNNYTINDLYINRSSTSYVGLFGYIGDGGEVRNVGLVDVDVRGGNYVGALAGYILGHILIANVYNSYATGVVHGENGVGGLIGSNNGGEMLYSYSKVDVSGVDRVGGFVGRSWRGGILEYSFSTGNVNGTEGVGGLVGIHGDSWHGGSLSNCYSTGNVSGDTRVGGLVGSNGGGERDATIKKSYAAGNVSGNSEFGGLVGIMLDSGIVENSFYHEDQPECSAEWYNSVSLNDDEFNSKSTFETAGWDIQMVETERDYPYLSWEEGEEGPIWSIKESETTFDLTIEVQGDGITDPEEGTHPYYEHGKVIVEAASGIFFNWSGDVESDNRFIALTMDEDKSVTANFKDIDYEISNWEHLYMMRFNLTGDYTLVDDLDEHSEYYDEYVDIEGGWEPIGDFYDNFEGTLDGNGHVINDLYLDTSENHNLGLFSFLGENSIVTNLSIVDINFNISGTSNDIGGLVGRNHGTVENCYVKGNISGSSRIGLLIGTNHETGVVSRSYTEGDINASGSAGGLVGRNRGLLNSSYSLASVNADWGGGLVGQNDHMIIESYSAGVVLGESAGGLVALDNGGTVENSFWDTETSGQDTSEGGQGKSTEEMKTKQTFTDVGWDFEDSWWIVEDLSYPQLRWQDDILFGIIYPSNGSIVSYADVTVEWRGGSIEWGLDHYEVRLNHGEWENVGMDNNHTFTGLDQGEHTVDVRLYYDNTDQVVTDSVTFELKFGDGTPEDPYIITDVHQLQDMNEERDAYYALENDIDASETIDWNDGDGFIPVGNNSESFTGGLDGRGYNITGLHIYREDTNHVGLFGYGHNLHVKDVNLLDMSITGNNRVGGLVGSEWYGTVENSYAAGEVTGEDHIGGLVGYNLGPVTGSSSSASITGSMNVGGLIGYQGGGSISDSYATGEVIGETRVGGLIGSGSGTFTTSYASGDVSGDALTGGFIGQNSGTVENCYAVGMVTCTGGSWVENYGGFVGHNQQSIIINSYSTGSVHHEGQEDPEDQGFAGTVDTGGEYYMSGNFWDTQTSGQTDTAGDATGKTTVEMQTENTFTEAGWDFINIWWIDEGNTYPLFRWDDGTPPPPPQDFEAIGGDGSVNLSWQPPEGGEIDHYTIYRGDSPGEGDEIATVDEGLEYTDDDVSNGITYFYQITATNDQGEGSISEDWATPRNTTGSQGDPHLIRNIWELQDVVYDLSAHYLVIDDIDATPSQDWNDGAGFEPLGSSSERFTGVFDGGDYNITGLYINRSNSQNVGIFSYLEGEIKSISLIEIEIIGESNVGSLVGRNYGKISYSRTKGNVSGNDNVGGLVGLNHGTLSDSYANIDVIGDEYIGGLVGKNDGTVKMSFAIGNVTETGEELITFAGGLVGLNEEGLISNSYAVANVTGTRQVGGLVGRNVRGQIRYSYCAGNVTGGAINVGGLVGSAITDDPYEDTANFWDNQTTGQTESDMGTGKNTIDMKTKSTFVDSDWDFKYVWMIDENVTYPRLMWEEGIGTPENPHLIWNIWDLQNVSTHLSGHYALANDIDGNVTHEWNDNAGFVPLGDDDEPFTGTLVGDGYEVTDLFINREDSSYVGLFGYLDEFSIVENLVLTDINITGKNRVGGLTGLNHGEVYNSSAMGIITGIDQFTYVGGLVGYNQGSISKSSFVGDVDGNNYAGGLVGSNWIDGYIEKSNATGSVAGTSWVGGLAGYNLETVSRSHAEVSVDGDHHVGGLVGRNFEGYIYKSYATSQVNGEHSVGGLVGSHSGGNLYNSHYNIDLVEINGENHVTIGGLFEDQYQDWFSNNLTLDIEDYQDTLIPDGEYHALNQTQGLRDLLGFASSSEYKFRLDDDIDLSGEQGLYIPYIRADFDGKGYTVSNLQVELPFISGVGMFGYNQGGTVINMALIDANVSAYNQVGTMIGLNEGSLTNSNSSGEVNGHDNVGGLVGTNENLLTNSSSIVNTQGNNNVGGLTGNNRGTIYQSRSMGNVAGNDNIGGLIGYNYGDDVERSYAKGIVTGNNRVGGLVGFNRISIFESYAEGTVGGNDEVGGLVGRNWYVSLDRTYATGSVHGASKAGGLVGNNMHGDISNSYSSGLVSGDTITGGLIAENTGGTITASFWDMNTSNQGSSAGGIGKNTSEMQTQSTFTDHGWDFVDTWWIIEDVTYPLFKWQGVSVGITSPEEGQIFATTDVTIEWEGSALESEDVTYRIRIDDEPWINKNTETSHEFTALDDGNHTVHVEVEDEHGNTATDSVTFMVDVSEPVINITDPEEGDAFSSTSVMVEWMGSDEFSGIDYYQIRINEEDWINKTQETSHEFSELEHGYHTVYVRAYDNAGNSAVDDVTFLIDLDLPNVEITSPEEGDIFNSTNIGVEWTGSDENSGIDYYEVRINEGDWIDRGTETDYEFTELEEGNHTVEVKAHDNAGNNATDQVTFVIDLTSPTVEIISPQEGEAFSTSTVYVEWTGEDDLSGIDHYQIRLNEGDWIDKNNDTSHEFTGLEEGSHFVEVRAYDNAGNFDTSGVNFIIDLTDSEITITSPEEDEIFGTTQVTVQWTGSDENSGIDYYEIRVDDGDWENVEMDISYTFQDLEEGHRTVEVRVTDNAGNYASDNVTFIVDVSAPTVSIISPEDGEEFETTDVTVEWTGEDEISGIEYYEVRINQGTWQNKGLQTSHTFTDLNGGEHTVDVMAYDNASNNAMDSVTFAIAFEIDHIIITPNNHWMTAGNSVEYTATAYDEHGGEIEDVTDDTNWSISEDAGGNWVGNIYHAEFAGTWTVTADYEGFGDTTNLGVGTADIHRIVLSPQDETITAGGNIDYVSFAYDEFGNEKGEVSPTYSIDDEAGGSWSNRYYYSEFAGTWTITGTYEGVTNTTSLTVEPSYPFDIVIDPEDTTILTGESQTYTATASDEFGNYLGDVTNDLSWSIDPGADGSWVDNVYTSENPGTWTVSASTGYSTGYATLIVESDIVEFTLDINAGAGGTTYPVPDEYIYEEGSTVPIEAQPDHGWQFSHWSGDVPEGQEENDYISIYMDDDKTVTAHFIYIEMYELTVNIDGRGSVDRHPHQAEYQEGTLVDLDANPDHGWEFSHWSGDIGDEPAESMQISIFIDDDKTVTAHFVEDIPDDEDMYVLTIQYDGSGSVDVDPLRSEYADGTRVTLRAEPDHGWEFVQWTGDASGTAIEITINMDRNKTVTAEFQRTAADFVVTDFVVDPTEGDIPLIVRITAEIENEGTGQGAIKLTMGDDLVTEWDLGPEESVSVEEEYTFNKQGLYYFHLGDQSLSVRVGEVVVYSLNVNIEGQGSVSHQELYEEGSEVTLNAVPETGWEFAEWSGDLVGHDRQITLYMYEDKTVTAVFQEIDDPDDTDDPDDPHDPDDPDDETTFMDTLLDYWWILVVAVLAVVVLLVLVMKKGKNPPPIEEPPVEGNEQMMSGEAPPEEFGEMEEPPSEEEFDELGDMEEPPSEEEFYELGDMEEPPSEEGVDELEDMEEPPSEEEF